MAKKVYFVIGSARLFSATRARTPSRCIAVPNDSAWPKPTDSARNPHVTREEPRPNQPPPISAAKVLCLVSLVAVVLARSLWCPFPSSIPLVPFPCAFPSESVVLLRSCWYLSPVDVLTPFGVRFRWLPRSLGCPFTCSLSLVLCMLLCAASVRYSCSRPGV